MACFMSMGLSLMSTFKMNKMLLIIRNSKRKMIVMCLKKIEWFHTIRDVVIGIKRQLKIHIRLTSTMDKTHKGIQINQ
jgi:hypothetical protein